MFVYCFSCRYLVELGLRQLGLPVPKICWFVLTFAFSLCFSGRTWQNRQHAVNLGGGLGPCRGPNVVGQRYIAAPFLRQDHEIHSPIRSRHAMALQPLSGPFLLGGGGGDSNGFSPPKIRNYYSADVAEWFFFSDALCQGCRETWREFWWNFPSATLSICPDPLTCKFSVPQLWRGVTWVTPTRLPLAVANPLNLWTESAVIKEPLGLKTEKFSKKSVLVVKRKAGFTKAISYTENLEKWEEERFRKSISVFY